VLLWWLVLKQSPTSGAFVMTSSKAVFQAWCFLMPVKGTRSHSGIFWRPVYYSLLVPSAFVMPFQRSLSRLVLIDVQLGQSHSAGFFCNGPLKAVSHVWCFCDGPLRQFLSCGCLCDGYAFESSLSLNSAFIWWDCKISYSIFLRWLAKQPGPRFIQSITILCELAFAVMT
jgi:hypothetical protein